MVIDYFNNHGYIDKTFYETYKNWIVGDLEKWSKSEKYSKQIFKRIIKTFSSEVNWGACQVEQILMNILRRRNILMILES